MTDEFEDQVSLARTYMVSGTVIKQVDSLMTQVCMLRALEALVELRKMERLNTCDERGYMIPRKPDGSLDREVWYARHHQPWGIES